VPIVLILQLPFFPVAEPLFFEGSFDLPSLGAGRWPGRFTNELVALDVENAPRVDALVHVQMAALAG